MFTRSEKEEQVTIIKEKLDKAGMIILAEYQGMTVEQISDFRRRLKKEGDAEYAVFKNTLVHRALDQESPLLKENSLLKGPNGMLFSYGDPAQAAKILAETAKKCATLKIKCGMLQDRFLNEADIKALAELPGREQLLSQVVGTMQAPIAGFVNTCAGVIRGFINCVNEVKSQKEAQAEA